MSTKSAASDWAAARGEKWREQITGMEAMLQPVEEPLLRALALDAPLRIADVGCGGGATALEIARRAPRGSVVHGFDISNVLVELARERARTHGDDRAVAFEVADMATAAPPENTYERLVSRFGVMFFDDPHAAFTNVARWLSPRGRFAFAVWGPLSDNPWMTTVRDVVARVVEVPQLDANAPGAFRYGDAVLLIAALERAGFDDLHVHDWRGALPIGGALTPADAAQFALAAFSSFGELLARAGDDALADAHRSLTTVFSDHHVAGAVRIDACVHIVTGSRLPARG